MSTEESVHPWVLWLAKEDAQTLLWKLCEWIDDPAISRERLSARVQTWQHNAHKAAGANAWHVRVDNSSGVCLDQRLYSFDRRMRTWS